MEKNDSTGTPEMDKRGDRLKILILLVVFFLFIISGISLRLIYSNSSYSDKEGRFIPSNPDGFFWLGSQRSDNELWDDYNPLKNKYFSLASFLILNALGLLIINICGKSTSMSILFVFFMFFSRFLYTKSAIGIYDHDYVGMCVFFILVLFLYLGSSFYLATPLVIYALSYTWHGLVPVAYLLLVIIFAEYMLRKRSWHFHVLKYLFYMVLAWLVIRNSFDPGLFVKETVFYPFYVIIMIPFILIGLWLSRRNWLWQGILIFATITLLHSGRTTIIAYPLIFLACAMVLKTAQHRKIICICLAALFLLFQIGNYQQLGRFGTELTDEGMYYLRDNTPKGSKILAWWDYGYYIEYLSNRSAAYGGNPESPSLKQLSSFFCNGSMPLIDFDYFINFLYQPELMPSILHYGGNNCIQSLYIDSISSDSRFKLVYSNPDVEIYQKLYI